MLGKYKIMVKVFICDQDNVRVDRFVRRHFPNFPQSILEKALRSKQIKVNDLKAKSSDRLQKEDQIAFLKDYTQFAEDAMQNDVRVLSKADRQFIENRIIFEDDDFCVFNKPSGLAVQGGSGIKNHVDGLFRYFKEGLTYRLVHRLDRDTSGVLILAKNPESAAYFMRLFKTHKIQKTYLALVHGRLKNQIGTIDIPIKKDMCDHIEKMIVSDDGKHAVTKYKELAKIQRMTLVQLQPLTGRTHQLRVHMQHLGYPIVGDYKYGAPKNKEKTRLHLHAYSVTFPYGNRQKEIMFKAEITEKDKFELVDDYL
jgi:23S rRNA pseudouridine955/2504/2580 synthase